MLYLCYFSKTFQVLNNHMRAISKFNVVNLSVYWYSISAYLELACLIRALPAIRALTRAWLHTDRDTDRYRQLKLNEIFRINYQIKLICSI